MIVRSPRSQKISLLIFSVALGIANRSAIAEPPPTTTSQSTSATNSGPRIQFAEPNFDFGRVDHGEMVKHEYFFTNSGDQMLEIRDVRASCGCTTPGNWDRKVEPGKTGKIPVQFNSSGYSGSVFKSVFVTCNDPAHTNVTLQLRGTIWKPIDVIPMVAMFNPGPEIQTNETRVIKIVNNLEEPLTLSDLQCTNQAFQATLKTVREGKEFELDITAIAPFHTTVGSQVITVKSSCAKAPLLSVNCYINVQPLLALAPSQITLPAGPLTNTPKYIISIRNNSTNLVTVSEPAINVPGAEIKLDELQPGRAYTLTTTFPDGFQSQPTQVMEASIKSTLASLPVVKIPIIQMPPPPRPATPAHTASPVSPAKTSGSPAGASASSPAGVAPATTASAAPRQGVGQ